MNFKKYFIIPALSALIFSACKKDNAEYQRELELLAPLVNTSLTLNDFIADSLLESDASGAMSIVYAYDLINQTAGDLFVVPDTIRVQTFTLDSLELGDRFLNQTLRLGTVYPPANLLNGQMFPIPAQNLTGIPPVPIDGSQYFNTVTLREGTMQVKIFNGFPVNINETMFRLLNNADNSLIFEERFTNIQPKTSQTRSVDLKGKTVKADLRAEILYLNTDASAGPVLINVNDTVRVDIALLGLRPFSATAIFPAQSVIQKDENTVYDLRDAQVKKMKLKEGKLKIEIVSTIQEKMYLTYEIPYAKKDGKSVYQEADLDPAPPGGISSAKAEFDLAGYEVDMRGNVGAGQDLYNAFYNVLDVRIDSTGKETSISLSDSIYVYYALVDMIPDYAEGYFGKQEYQAGPDKIKLELLKNATGNWTPDEARISLKVDNGAGITGVVEVKEVTGINTRSGRRVPLSAAQMQTPLAIAPAIRNPFQASTQGYFLDKSNSNSVAFFGNLPDEILYNARVMMNPNGNINNWGDFVYDFSNVRAQLLIDLPLHGVADNITLETLQDWSLGKDVDQIRDGTVYLIADNLFPLQGKVQMYFMQDGNMIDSVFAEPKMIRSGTPAGPLSEVKNPERTILEAYISEEKMARLRIANKAKLVVTLNSFEGQQIKIFSNAKVDLKLTGRFNYGVK